MKKLFSIIFLIIQIVFIIFDLSMEIIFKANLDYDLIHYLIICIDFLFALIFLMLTRRSDNVFFIKSIFIVLALFFTVISDTGLVLIGVKHNDLFVSTFILAQLFIFLYITYDKFYNKSIIISLIVFGLSLIGLFLNYIVKINMDIVIYVSVIYGIVFISNIVLSFILLNIKERKNQLLIVGLILYFLCDLCIAIGNFHPSSILAQLIWVFYLPGEVLITYHYLYSSIIAESGK